MRLLDSQPRLRRLAERFVDRHLPVVVLVSPTYAQIEINNRCNLRCVMCAISELTAARPLKNMTAPEFAAIASQLPALRRVDLQGIAEPLLNPNLEAIVAWCRAHDLEVGFVTNGLLLEGERVARVLDARPTHIVVSLDSTDPEVYAGIRSGAKVARVLANVAGLVAERARRGAAAPHVSLMAIAMRDTVAGLAEVVRTGARLGVDGVTIKGLNTAINPALEELNVSTAVEAIRAAAAESPRLGVTVACEVDRSRLHCRWPWTAAYITVEGRLTPCCNCPDARVVDLGDLTARPFTKLWNAPAYRAFRRALAHGVPPVCATCPDY